MISINAYGCSTSAGKGVEALWVGVQAGRSFVSSQVCLWPGERNDSQKERLLSHLIYSWQEAKAQIDPQTLGRVGVILSSTKGFVEDHVWANEMPATDLMTPLLNLFCRQTEIVAAKKIVVSNACASSLSAVWLAERWLNSSAIDSVVILAADGVGPFVTQGFQCLHALTLNQSRPFSRARDGLQLGEAAAVLVLSKRSSALQISGVAIDVEGYAVTRPSPSGESLRRATQKLTGTPDLIVAHGTGTVLNDEIEDQIYFQQFGKHPWITGSKWSIGHTLGASGAVDLILAGESIRRGEVFNLGRTPEVDPKFHCQYLVRDSQTKLAPARVLVSSLGFGGVHAVAMVEKAAL
jgi:3-oxoacyl-[acyl-carrier-protein] synthase-1